MFINEKIKMDLIEQNKASTNIVYAITILLAKVH